MIFEKRTPIMLSIRQFRGFMKVLLTLVTILSVIGLLCINEWYGSYGDLVASQKRSPRGLSTMKTIIAYSEGKQAELDRPSPVTCEKLPPYPEIKYFNRTWAPNIPYNDTSWQHVPSRDVFLYSAFYDDRGPQHYVRILAAFKGRNFSEQIPLYCQTRSTNPSDDVVEVVAAKPLDIWHKEWDPNSLDVETPLLLSCPLTEPLYHNLIVSIVTQPCDIPRNAFSLERTSSQKKSNRKFTVCVKDMNFSKDISKSLIEWIETNKILGVEMIDMYVDSIKRNSEEVLLHYQRKGIVRLFKVPIRSNPSRSLWQRRRDHIITYNDCLYRNIEESKYIVPLDIDEIVLPKKADNWHQLIDRLMKHGWNPSRDSAILVQNVFFFEFMQDANKYSHSKTYKNSKIYTKRDDVRIEKYLKTNVNEIELTEESSNIITNNEILDNTEVEDNLYDRYKSRCGAVLPEPKLATHIVRSAVVSPVGYYSKSLMLTKKVLTVFNHYPLASIHNSGFNAWSAPFNEVQLNHYKESCNTTLVVECGRYGLHVQRDRAALRLRTRLTRALAQAMCIPVINT